MTSKIEQNTIVSVHYTGTFTDGEVFDSSEGRDPLTFLVGHGQMITGFEQEMLGAEVGEKREFTLTPDRAYGERTDAAIQEVPRDQFPEGMAIEVGMVLGAQSEQGPVQFSVASIDDEVVTVDFNHQMAGMTLNFSVEVVDVRAASEEELAHGHVHGPGGHQH
ncbi:MAG: peptidylprolyl isomerase [Candidatus Thalassarchaeaceae archaeon]